MKNSRIPFALLLAAGCLPLVGADAPQKKLRVLAAANEPAQKVEKRIVIRHGDGAAEMKKVTFLGVETSPVSADLSAQLNLAPETGLLVRHVVPGSPAAGVLQPHDLLLKLEDQLLIAPRQFAVLVRTHKAGDEISLTYLRGGKEATVKLKLAEHEVPKVAIFGANQGGDLKYFVHSGGQKMAGEDLNRTLALLDRAHANGEIPHRITVDGPSFRSTTVNTSNSAMVFTDEQGSLELTIKDGKKTLVAKNPKGEQVFSGPIDTPEQKQALPADVRDRLGKIEVMQEFNFRADEASEADVLKAVPHGIALPQPEEGLRLHDDGPDTL